MDEQKELSIGDNTGINYAFFQAASHKGVKDPLADAGVKYERDLVFAIISNPDYLLMHRWPASTIVRARSINDAPVECGVLGDNLLWFFGTKKEWLLKAYCELGDNERTATANVYETIKALFLASSNDYLKEQRHHIAGDVRLYAHIMLDAYPLFNARVADALKRFEEIRIERGIPDFSLDALFPPNSSDGQ